MISTMNLWLGLISWMTIGFAAGLSASLMLPGEPKLHWALAACTGIGGALGGGFVATALGFGGMAAFDPRSLITATLSAVLCLLLLRYLTLADSGS